jgi:hypothetical protein
LYEIQEMNSRDNKVDSKGIKLCSETPRGAFVDPAGIEPATKRIQALIQFGYIYT